MKPLLMLLLPLMATCGISCSKSSGAPIPDSNVNFIPKEQANQMINSYLRSVGYPGKDDEVRSWLLDAAAIREYLSDTSIVRFKVFLGHTMDWINAGNGGVRPGPGEFPNTLILVGVNRQGKYQLVRGKVMDNAAPCPQLCMDAALESHIE